MRRIAPCRWFFHNPAPPGKVAWPPRVARGLLYAGLQYGGQCFAGNTLGYQKAKPADEGTACGMKCSADSSQDCGGIWFNTVYSTGLSLGSQPPASAYQGCFEDRKTAPCRWC
jgi:hypothetical protein